MGKPKEGFKRVDLHLEDKLYDHLQSECDKTGLTMAEFLRRIIENRNGSEVRIDFLDIDQFSERQSNYIQMLKALLPIIVQSENVYQQDIDDIKESIEKIDSLTDEIWRYVTSTRERMYNDVRNKICKKITDTSYTVRKVKSHKPAKEPKENPTSTWKDGYVN